MPFNPWTSLLLVCFSLDSSLTALSQLTSWICISLKRNTTVTFKHLSRMIIGIKVMACVGEKHWNCTNLNKKLLKQIIKGNVVLWQLKINFKLHSFLHTPRPGDEVKTSWRLNTSYISYQFCLAMKQCSRVGIPLEQKPLKLHINLRFLVQPSTNDFKALSLIKAAHPLD